MNKFVPAGDILKLNVGGDSDNFIVSRQLLTSVPGSDLATTFSGKHDLQKVDGKIFLDRNP